MMSFGRKVLFDTNVGDGKQSMQNYSEGEEPLKFSRGSSKDKLGLGGLQLHFTDGRTLTQPLYM